MHSITPAELWHKRQSTPITLIDVRNPGEYATIHAEGAENIPLDRIDAATISHLDAHKAVYVICKSGARSQIAIPSCSFMRKNALHSGTCELNIAAARSSVSG